MFWLNHQPNLSLPIILFLLAFFIAVHATGLLRRVAEWLGVLDHPDARKRQAVPVPRLGGVAIYLSVVLSLGVALILSDRLAWSSLTGSRAILLVGTLVFLAGLLDDLFRVRAALKLAVLAVGCLLLVRAGIGVNRTPWPALNYVLTFLWVAGVASAFNAIDNTDGLAGSIGLVSCAALFALGWATWQLEFSFLAMGLAGGLLGFLHHNLNPARIYMGDSGSFFVGYLVAVLVIFGEWSDDAWQSLFAGGLIVLLPVYDLGLTSLLRLRHGVVHSLAGVIAHSDTDHLSHRLRHMGYSQRRMLFVLGGLHAICCLVALLVARRSAVQMAVAFGVLGVLLTALAAHVDRNSSVPELWSIGRTAARRARDGGNGQG